jgi:hypothetical protein
MKAKKTTQYGYPAYQYTHNGIGFRVWSAYKGEWYINFNSVFFISEQDGAREYRTKKQALAKAIYYIENN